MDPAPPMQNTLQPTCTGTSVVALIYDEGVAILADTVVSYGKSARFKGISRQYKVNDKVIVAFSGDHADFHCVQNIIERQVAKWNCYGQSITPKALHSFLGNLFYSRRSRMNPFWNTLVVAGWETAENRPFLGVVTQKGVAYETRHLGSGFASMLLNQFIEDDCKDKSTLNRAKAEGILRKCIELTYYRDCCADNAYDIGIVERESAASIKAQPPVIGDWSTAELNCQYD